MCSSRLVRTIILCIATSFCGNAVAAEYIRLPIDSNGWSAPVPSSDSRIMYISATGNDTTGVAYTQSAHPDWSNPFDGTGVSAFATMNGAKAHMRTGYPDWILYKRGEVFTEDWPGNFIKTGRSKTEPAIIGSYGLSGSSPVLQTGENSAAIYNTDEAGNIAVLNLDFYSYTRDPNNPSYVTPQYKPSGIFLYAGSELNVWTPWLFEGCKFRFYATNEIQTTPQQGGITIRRCAFLDTYKSGFGDSTGHSQGLFVAGVDGLQIVESVFDHNGWLIQSYDGTEIDGQATIYNHNTYFGNTRNILFEDNIFLRPSSIQNKFSANNGANSSSDLVMKNNLYIDGEAVFSVGGNEDDPLKFKNVIIDGNVITNANLSRPTNRELAFVIEIQDWDGGTVKDNLTVHNDEGNSFYLMHVGTSRNVIIQNNIVYDFAKLGRGFEFSSERGTDIAGSQLSGNILSVPSVIGISGFSLIDKVAFSNNKYTTVVADGSRFKLNGVDKSDAEWATLTGDNSIFEQHIFPDPTRSIETYMASLGETATIDAFIAKARSQDRYNWDPNITAEAANAWIKVGFGMGQRRLFRNVRLHTEE